MALKKTCWTEKNPLEKNDLLPKNGASSIIIFEIRKSQDFNRPAELIIMNKAKPARDRNNALARKQFLNRMVTGSEEMATEAAEQRFGKNTHKHTNSLYTAFESTFPVYNIHTPS